MKIDKIDNDSLTFYNVYVEPEEAKKWLTQAYFDVRKEDVELQQVPSYNRLDYQDLLDSSRISTKDSELFTRAVRNHMDEIIEAIDDDKEIVEYNYFIEPNDDRLSSEGFYILLHGFDDDSKYSLTQEKIQEILGDQESFYDQIADKYLRKQQEVQYRLEPVEKNVDFGDYVRLSLKHGEAEDSDIFHFGFGGLDNRVEDIQSFFDLALRDKKVGDEFELMANPDVTCTVEQVYELEIPEIDDEFVSEITEFDTLEEFKKNFASPDNMNTLKFEALLALEDYLLDLGVFPETLEQTEAELTEENKALIEELKELGWSDLRTRSSGLKNHLYNVPSGVFYHKFVEDGVSRIPTPLEFLNRERFLGEVNKIEEYLVSDYLKDIREEEIENEDN